MKKRIKINYNQMALPFEDIRGGALASYDARVRYFWLLAGITFLSFFAYVYAINALARHIAVRQSLEKEASALAAEIGSLEFAYIEKRNEITIETARLMGFAEVGKPLYVSRDSRAGALSFNTESE